MAAPEPDSRQDWTLPEERRPPLIGELEQRIDEALATARASEAAAMTIGAAAIDAAEQARRAAELAERAASSAAEAQRGAAAAAPRPSGLDVTTAGGPPAGSPSTGTVSSDSPRPAPGRSGAARDSLGDFDERADRLMERLQRLQRVPLGPASAAAAPPQARP